MRGYTMNKDDYLKRLRRIEGQVRGFEHVRHCVRDAAAESPQRADAMIEEATRAIERLVRA